MIESEHGHDGILADTDDAGYWTDSGTYLGNSGHSMVIKNVCPWIAYTETAPQLTERQYKLLLKRAKQCDAHFTLRVHGSWIEPKNVCMFNKEV